METVIVFQLAEQSFALSINHIKEIVLTPDITPLPLAPAHYCGVANVRGKVLAIIDLAQRFGINVGEAGQARTFTLVVAHPTQAIGFRVAQMPHTLNVHAEQIEPAPPFAQDEILQFCKGLIKHEKGLIVWLDLPELLEKETVA